MRKNVHSYERSPWIKTARLKAGNLKPGNGLMVEENFITIVKHWHELPREVLEALMGDGST